MRGRGSCGSCGSSAHLDGEVELVRLLLGLTAAQAGQLGQGGADLRRGEGLVHGYSSILICRYLLSMPYQAIQAAANNAA